MLSAFMNLITAAVSVTGAPTDLNTAVRRYDTAQIRSDKRELELLLADDYVLVSSDGGVEGKEEFIADQVQPDYKLDPFSIISPIQRRWRDGAVIGGVALLKGQSEGKPFEVCLRFADIWRRKSGRWQVVYTQAARLKSDDCITDKS